MNINTLQVTNEDDFTKAQNMLATLRSGALVYEADTSNEIKKFCSTILALLKSSNKTYEDLGVTKYSFDSLKAGAVAKKLTQNDKKPRQPTTNFPDHLKLHKMELRCVPKFKHN